MTREELDQLLAGEPETAAKGYLLAMRHLDSLKGLSEMDKQEFSRLGRQVGQLDQWPEAERSRYRRLALIVHAALGKASTGVDGWPLVPPSGR